MKRRLIIALAVPVATYVGGVISRTLRRRGNTRAAQQVDRFVAPLRNRRQRSKGRRWRRR